MACQLRSLVEKLNCSQKAIACVELGLNGTELALSVFIHVLLTPQRVVEIEDTLTESGAARVDTDVGACQARLPPIVLIGGLDGTGAATPIRSAAREQIKVLRDIVTSNLRGESGGAGFASPDSSHCRIAAGIRWESFCIYNADCKSRRTRLEPLLSASGSIRRN